MYRDRSTCIPYIDEVAFDPYHTINTTLLGWSAHEKCELTFINNRNQVRKSWHLEHEWSTREKSEPHTQTPVCVLLIWRPISLSLSVIKEGSLEGSTALPPGRPDRHFLRRWRSQSYVKWRGLIIITILISKIKSATTILLCIIVLSIKSWEN